jgi:hypothetical protein
VNPSKLVNERGGVVFSQHWRATMKKLRKDVKKGRHLRMTPSQLQARRKVYHPYKKRIFKERMYQEVRRQKFFAYLEWKRRKNLPKSVGTTSLRAWMKRRCMLQTNLWTSIKLKTTLEALYEMSTTIESILRYCFYCF